MELPGLGFAVAPRTDCPHVERLRLSQIPIPNLPSGQQPPCEVCGDSSENWMCLHCLDILCSRYVQGHMAEHAAHQHSSQNTAFSLTDHSFWCYACDDYVTTEPLEAWLRGSLEGQSSDAEEAGDKGKAPIGHHRSSEPSDDQDEEHDRAPATVATLESVAASLAEGRVKQIVAVTGAGISTSAVCGIPDYRSEGGLYSTLHKYGVDPAQLSHPTQVFELGYFKENPEPFWAITRDLFYAHQSRPRPTPCHWFLRLLHDKGVLRRVYTQNIDGLELDAGVSCDVVMQAHGGNQAAHCVECGGDCDVQWMEEECKAGKIPRCKLCNGLVKPAVVLFGEGLPHKMFQLLHDDRESFHEGDGPDMVMVLGTSLKVGPVNMIPSLFPGVPRVLINRELVGDFDPEIDCCLLGDIDEGVTRLAQMAGWGADLDRLLSATS